MWMVAEDNLTKTYTDGGTNCIPERERIHHRGRQLEGELQRARNWRINRTG